MNRMNNSHLDTKTKIRHMKQLADFRDNELRKNPLLKFLFIEMTNRCNERCRHCGSSCGEGSSDGMLSGEEIKAFLKKTASQFDISELMLCITGGEPLLREDFFEIMAYARSLGYSWGMTSNGTLIDERTAKMLAEAGMKTISVSLDGLPETNDWFRQKKGGFDAALNGVRSLIGRGECFKHVQVTTVVHKKNIDELPRLYEILRKEHIRSWRVIGIEPIGRALGCRELLLDRDDYIKMFDFIKEHYLDPTLPVLYGCSHYLGAELEREIRPWYFLCNAGVYTASIMWNGDIAACLDIERRPELIQGNIRRDDFKEVWESRFECFRNDFREKGGCKGCSEYKFCAGGAFHSWSFDENRQNVCFKGILF